MKDVTLHRSSYLTVMAFEVVHICAKWAMTEDRAMYEFNLSDVVNTKLALLCNIWNFTGSTHTWVDLVKSRYIQLQKVFAIERTISRKQIQIQELYI